MADKNKLVALGMAPELADQLAEQIDESVSGKAQIAALTNAAVPFADLTAAANKVNEIIAALKA